MRQPALERGRFGRDDAGVDHAQAALVGIGIFLLDDRGHPPLRITNDAPVAAGIVQLCGQHRQAPGRSQQAAQGGGADQRHVAVQHQHRGRIGDRRGGLLHGMAGTQALGLFGPVQVGLVGERGHHLLAFMAMHDVDARRIQPTRGGDDLRKHRLAANRLQDLGPRGAHALAFASGQDDDMQGTCHGCSTGIFRCILERVAASMRAMRQPRSPGQSPRHATRAVAAPVRRAG